MSDAISEIEAKSRDAKDREASDAGAQGRAPNSPRPDDQPGQTDPSETPGEGNKSQDDKDDGFKTPKPSFWSRIQAHPILTVVVLLALLAALVGGVLWWLQARQYESTDDAFIDARPVPVSAMVAGEIVDVPVTDNQLVHAGDVLARIDQRDYAAAQDQAIAQLQQAEAGVQNVLAQIKAQQANIEQATKQVTEAQAALNFSNDENGRYQSLVQQGAGTVQRAQQAASDLQQKRAAVDAAVAGRDAAQAQLGVLRAQEASGEAQVRQAQAQGEQAAANLSRIVLRASEAGRVTRISGAKGAYAAPGQALMTLVPTHVWVTANFKETQLADMRPGQKVDIEVDAFGRTFAGHIDSMQAGSGTAFSLLPAENATGNYVKVVQRVPVKIVFDQPPDVELGPGMSVVPSVKVQ